MYNAMIAPLHPYAIRGIVWYQGEANAHDNGGRRYAKQMEALISGWRKAWQRELPFYFVQIAPWNYSGYQVGEVPLLREAQFNSLSIPNTGMVVTTDLLEPAGLESGHPLNKREVGERLAKWALAKTYGQGGLVCSGPLFKSFEIEGSQIRLHFQYAAGMKSADGQPLGEFEVGGVNDHFAPASAQIEGDSIVVHSKMVPAPTQVRFAWRNLANPNLVNGAGLPASPFRTRDWQAPKSE
jgi:sialate O-acetylesterase